MERNTMIIGDRVRKLLFGFPMVGTAIAFGRRGNTDTCFVAWDSGHYFDMGEVVYHQVWENEDDLHVIETFAKSMV